MSARQLLCAALVGAALASGCKSYHAGGCGLFHRNKRCDQPLPQACPPPGPTVRDPFTTVPPAPVAPVAPPLNPAALPGPTPDFTTPRGRSSYSPPVGAVPYATNQ